MVLSVGNRRQGKPLAINNRGVYVDKFWFSFIHEIRHVLSAKRLRRFFIAKRFPEEMTDINNKLEIDAEISLY